MHSMLRMGLLLHCISRRAARAARIPLLLSVPSVSLWFKIWSDPRGASALPILQEVFSNEQALFVLRHHISSH